MHKPILSLPQVSSHFWLNYKLVKTLFQNNGMLLLFSFIFMFILWLYIQLPLMVWGSYVAYHMVNDEDVMSGKCFPYNLSFYAENPPVTGGRFCSQKISHSQLWCFCVVCLLKLSLRARFMGPKWGPSWADRTQVGPCWPHEFCYLGWSKHIE